MKRIEIAGQRFGRLVVVKFHGPNSIWECLCDCGETKLVKGGSLRNGSTRSCGCLNREQAASIKFSHGEARVHNLSPEYRAYGYAKTRCQNPAAYKYPSYGGRGIQFKFKSFEEFLAALGRRPSEDHSVDRIDNNGHYEPGNVRWATRSQQMRNRRPIGRNDGQEAGDHSAESSVSL